MPGRNAQVARIYAILNLLEGTPQGLTVPEITARMKERGHDASKRTIYRDLEALNAAGFPLFPSADGASEQVASRWVLERTARINQYLVLSPRELVALFLARQVLAPLRDTPFFADLERLFQKIEEKLGTKGRDHLESLGKDIHFEPGPLWGLGVDPGVLDSVQAACAEGQLLSCDYASVKSRSKKRRVLGPHYLYFAKGSLYLVAEDLATGAIKTYSLPRMSSAEMQDEPYEGERSDPEAHFKDSFGVFRGDSPVEVRIQFAPEVAPFMRERSWHPTQKVISKPDGIIELQLHVALTPELLQWVLGFGAHATVIEPIELRHSIAEEASRLTARYRSDRKAA